MSVTISNFGSDPLPIGVTKLLTDKLYEKRKTAALDVEKIIRDYLNSNNHVEITKIVKFLSNSYVLSQNQNNKKGGLIGLAASAIALGKEAHKYRNDLVPCVLACFSDPDSRVRYYACEALYNIVKVLKSCVLVYFNEIFDGLSKLCCDGDSNVRNGAELLDRLLKDTILENTNNTEKFDLETFMPLFRERIYAKNSFVRQFLVSWLRVLDSEPNLNVIYYIADLLDGLFQILDDTNPEIKKMCESLLGELLKEIIGLPQEIIRFDDMINIILTHAANSSDDLIQFTAMQWLKDLSLLKMEKTLNYLPGILNVILPCLAYSDENSKRNIRDLAKQINAHLWSLIDKLESSNILALNKVIESLLRHLTSPNDTNSVNTTFEALKWFYHLVNKQSEGMLDHIEEYFSILVNFLSFSSKEVVELDLQILANISSSSYLKEKYPQPNDDNKYNLYFNKFMIELLRLFQKDLNLRYEKGPMIIKELSILMNPEDIYKMFAKILLDEQDTDFTLEMVDILNSILLTSNELYELRNILIDFDTEKSYELFTSLYKTWSHNPIATIALCLLSQNYEHAFNLINLFANIEVNLSLLNAIDRLVQLIESPIFTYLRLHLLNFEKNQYLVRALYGLLMLLPQSDAFLTLKQRLDCVPNYCNKISQLNTELNKTNEIKTQIDFKNLLAHFIEIQDKHRFFKKQKYIDQYRRFLNNTSQANDSSS